jgi:hypothetical protein
MNEHRVLSDDDMPKMSSPRHIRHCIELLRQVLMCQPDLTLEVKNLSVGGVAGFGTEHQCRDWNQLMSFTKSGRHGVWMKFLKPAKVRTIKATILDVIFHWLT